MLFIGASEALATAVDPNLTVSYDFLPETVDAACADPDATAAETMRVEYTGLAAIGDTAAELCFANRSDVAGMAVVPSQNGTRTIVTNSAVYQNSALLTDGNAALVAPHSRPP